jgi:hypothetical protein
MCCNLLIGKECLKYLFLTELIYVSFSNTFLVYYVLTNIFWVLVVQMHKRLPLFEMRGRPAVVVAAWWQAGIWEMRGCQELEACVHKWRGQPREYVALLRAHCCSVHGS